MNMVATVHRELRVVGHTVRLHVLMGLGGLVNSATTSTTLSFGTDATYFVMALLMAPPCDTTACTVSQA